MGRSGAQHHSGCQGIISPGMEPSVAAGARELRLLPARWVSHTLFMVVIIALSLLEEV